MRMKMAPESSLWHGWAAVGKPGTAAGFLDFSVGNDYVMKLVL